MRNILISCVNYRRVQDTIACLDSLSSLELANFSVDIVLCDNSPQDTRGMIDSNLSNSFFCEGGGEGAARLYKKNNANLTLTIFDSWVNGGFASGCNLCLQAAPHEIDHYDYIWFLNNDTMVPSNCLTEMVNKFARSECKVGICGSTMVYFHDKKTVQALGGSVYKPLTGTMYEIGNGTQWPHPVDESAIEATMSYVCGASMLVSVQLIKDVGLMQEDYFLFYEEIDWCTRARKAGYQLAYASQAVVYHKEGAAIGTGMGAKRSLLAEYYGMRNKLMVTRRFFPWALPSVWLVGWAQVLRRALQGRLDNAKIMAQVLCGLGRAPR